MSHGLADITMVTVLGVAVSYRPDLLVRAARHYEGAGQVLLRKAVMSSQRFISIEQGEVQPLGQWQEVECPARLDLAGDWIKVFRVHSGAVGPLDADPVFVFQAAGATLHQLHSSTGAPSQTSR